MIEGINRALAFSYYMMAYDVAQTVKSESGYGYHSITKNTSFDTSVSNTLNFATYTPNSFEYRVCSVVLTLRINIGGRGRSEVGQLRLFLLTNNL